MLSYAAGDTYWLALLGNAARLMGALTLQCLQNACRAMVSELAHQVTTFAYTMWLSGLLYLT